MPKTTRSRRHRLTFGKLRRGNRFIVFPRPDNDEEDGDLQAHWIFVKCSRIGIDEAASANAVRLRDGIALYFRDDEEVLKVV